MATIGPNYVSALKFIKVAKKINDCVSVTQHSKNPDKGEVIDAAGEVPSCIGLILKK